MARSRDDLFRLDGRLALEINLVSNFALAQAVAPYMIERRSGRIIFITSTAAHLGWRP